MIYLIFIAGSLSTMFQGQQDFRVMSNVWRLAEASYSFRSGGDTDEDIGRVNSEDEVCIGFQR